jgi:hypothetical protein
MPFNEEESLRTAPAWQAIIGRFPGGGARPVAAPLILHLQAHLGAPLSSVPVVIEEWAAWEQVAVQLALAK